MAPDNLHIALVTHQRMLDLGRVSLLLTHVCFEYSSVICLDAALRLHEYKKNSPSCFVPVLLGSRMVDSSRNNVLTIVRGVC